MKKILIIMILMCITLVVVAQRSEAWKTVVLYTSSITLNAIGDGLNDSGNKAIGHICNALSIGVLLSMPLLVDFDKDKWYMYLISYTFIRIGVFDYTYNATRGLPYSYVGNSSLWDKFLRELKPPDGFITGRVILFSAGIIIPFNDIYPKKRYDRQRPCIY